MTKPIPVACPKCDGNVTVAASAGGRGSGELTSYYALCASCGTLVDDLGSTGRRDSAVRAYNRWVRERRVPLAVKSVVVQGGYFSQAAARADTSVPSEAEIPPSEPTDRYAITTDDEYRKRRIKNFGVRAELTTEPDFVGEKTFWVTKNGRQEFPTSLAPHEARKLYDLLKVEFGF